MFVTEMVIERQSLWSAAWNDIVIFIFWVKNGSIVFCNLSTVIFIQDKNPCSFPIIFF